MYSTVSEVCAAQAATADPHGGKGNRPTGSILQAGLTWRTLAWRRELLFDRVRMRWSRGLCQLMNLPHKQSMKAKSVWLNLIVSWTQSRRPNNVDRNLWPANRQRLCVIWQRALLVMAVKTNQTEEQLKSMLQVFRLHKTQGGTK